MSNIKYKGYLCQDVLNNKEIEIKVPDNTINLYLYMTSGCNASCPFCEFKGKKIEPRGNINKLIEFLKKEKCEIFNIHITGGEPSSNIEELTDIIGILKGTYKDSLISINTNGINIEKLLSIRELDNISLSRHAITDKENYDIFQTKSVPSIDRIQQLNNKNKLHLSCNLIKGYIDSTEKVKNYLEFASELGITDIGLVSLMDKNEYCKQRLVDFSLIDKELENYNIVKHKCYRDINPDTHIEYCRCSNYIYQAKNFKLICMYHRHAINSTGIADYLVYNYETGELKQGFSGEIIKEISGR